MQLNLKQLPTSLDKKVYLISGDEPLLLQDARDILVQAFSKKGFCEKQLIHMDTGFESTMLQMALQNQDLFSEKKILDLRNEKAKFDADIITLFQKFYTDNHPDLVMIITTGKLSAAQQKSAWFQLIQQHGHYLTLWPIKSEQLPQWIVERAKTRFSLDFPIDLTKILSFFSEGNLLAVEQALMKLSSRYEKTTIQKQQLLEVLSDHARFNVFDLSNALSQRNAKKTVRVLDRLEKTGEEPVLVLWSICRELRMQKNLKALQLAAKTDEIIKGATSGDVWLSLKTLCLMGCGYEI